MLLKASLPTSIYLHRLFWIFSHKPEVCASLKLKICKVYHAMSQLSVEWIAIDKRLQLLIYFISKKKEMVLSNQFKFFSLVQSHVLYPTPDLNYLRWYSSLGINILRMKNKWLFMKEIKHVQGLIRMIRM